ncbi:ecto-ADP-ribosyltransferase 3 isoform X2 [Nannospalax galili]|uniref:ecto-ADP-ribosyltransferase 3 isoform X2 n=1 Tax=Nannospalax galili TaxID=1026970 RepID=UPI0004ED37C1|nr:ecto-ADP-ribosyltransferase 3 isoform X2 [Nannospalax galili]
MKMRHFEMVTMLLAAMILMDIFQVKAEMLDMAEDAFDDEYQKCSNRMEMKYVPQLLSEELANLQLLETVWENAKIKWEARKAGISLPLNFKDNYGVALMAYVSEAQEQTPFYHMFNQAVKTTGQSRKDYIYDFQFKAFHFYLVRGLQVLRRPCEESYKSAVYSTSQDISFAFGGINRVRLGSFTLAYSTKPPATDQQYTVLTIYPCFGVPVEKFFGTQSKRIVLIPLSEIFQVSPEGAGNDLVLQSTNKTCSHYECAFLGGLKSENCVENPEHLQPMYIYNPDEENQKLEDSGMKRLESTEVPDKSQGNVYSQTPGPAPGPAPVPGPKTHPSASSGRMLLPTVGTFFILISASAVNILIALSLETS